MGARRRRIVSTHEFLQDVGGKEFLDFPVPGDRLSHAGLRIPVPIMPSAVPDQGRIRRGNRAQA